MTARSPETIPDIPLHAALAYALLGYRVFPLGPKSKIPATPRGYHNATTDHDLIRKWWAENPRYGIGIDCYDSEVVGIDVDPRHGGLETLARLEAELGPLPESVRVCTGSDGLHVYLNRSEGLTKARGSLGPGVDIKLNGYLVAPPSVHPDTGRRYQWTRPPNTNQTADLPPAWLAAILPATTTKKAPTITGRRTSGVSSRYGLKALEDECAALHGTCEGGRNNRLNQAAFSLVQLVEGGELDESEAHASLLDAALASGLGDRESAKTIASGFKDGRGFPRRAPEQTGRPPAPSGSIPDQDPTPDAPQNWEDGLAYKTMQGGGQVLAKTAGNLALLLANQREWKGALAFDELAYRATWTAEPPPCPGRGLRIPSGHLEEAHCTYVRHWFRLHYGIDFGQQDTLSAVNLAAQTGRYHPVQDYLYGLQWDGIERVSSWLSIYMGAAEQTPIGQWWLISAVARALRPGCQVDHVLILEGKQGSGKSSALRIMAGDWYQGKLGDISDKDGVQSLLGSWIVEIGELDAFKGKEATRIKDFLSQQVDRYRPSFGKWRVDRPRGCVFSGTTNDATYLHDPSGARRFWPVLTGKFNLYGLERDRDQLWAEAVHLFRQGTAWYPITEEEHGYLAEQAEDRLAQDPWEEKLIVYLASHFDEEFTSRELLTDALDVTIDHQTRYDSMRLGSLLRRLGWKRFRSLTGRDKRVYVYRRPE
uniref:Putative VirE domain containing protein n=1 Tax=viral metagenome TaxID=1070528 RepID=A0A6M3X8I0_9ZZZZ